MYSRSKQIKHIVERVFRKKYPNRIIRLDEVAYTRLVEEFQFDEHRAIAFIRSNINLLWAETVKRLDEDVAKGLLPTFEILDSSRYELIWFPAVWKTDSSKLARQKMRIKYRGELLDYLDHHITWRDYEALGCVISILVGARQWNVTPSSGDFGIDFFALIPSYGISHLFPGVHKQIRLVGQSKKWNSEVPRSKVDDLGHKLDYIRARSHHFDGILPPWFLSEPGLIVGCMIAHSSFQEGANTIAHEHGLILGDRRDIVEILTLSHQWSVEDGYDKLITSTREKINLVLSSKGS
jgi:hypothetical protein